ncbi:MAG: DNA polymerase I [Lachnospiraceae bacterium]|nr:DNA polymerase I [Lachnospiraceae bacterium]
MEKLVLIDGHSMLNRAFYGLPDLTNSEGLHTNAVYGFLNILFRIIEQEKPDYLTVAFDVHAPTFRHKMFDGYKGTRKPMAEELRQQVPLMKEMLHAMGVCVVEKEGYEADDVLGTLAYKGEEQGMEVRLISGDRDMLQLATDHICIRIPKTRKGVTTIEDYFAKDVVELYGVTPKEFIDMKALMGDTSDNIPGIPGVGEKTAGKLIATYHSIENAYEHREEVKPNKAKESLSNFYDQAVLSKELATIITDCPLEYRFEDAKYHDLYTPEAYKMCRRLEFKNLLSRFETAQVEVKNESSYQEALTENELENLVQEAKGKKIALMLYGDPDIMVLLCESRGGCFKITDRIFAEKQLQLLCESAATIVAFEGKKLLKYLGEEQVELLRKEKKLLDISVASYLLNPLLGNYTYDQLASEYLSDVIMTKEELLGKHEICDAFHIDRVKGKKDPLLTEEHAIKAALFETGVTYKCYEAVLEKLDQEGMMELYYDMELPLIYVLDEMEKNGISVNAGALKQYGDNLVDRITELEQSIYEIAGEEFNINSPKQLGVILFEKLKMPNGKKTKTGYSTAADVLEKLEKDYPIVKQILEYRTLTKLKSTYADGLANYIGEDQRIHSTFNQTITATGRISSTEPNLQNIPIRMELGRLIRKVFVPKEGYVFVDADYSQIELRLLAHLSGDENLIQAFRQHMDIHATTASQVFHVPFEEVTPELRRNAKAVNFGIVYGISAFGLSQDLDISVKEAASYIESYFAAYPKIKSYLDGLVEGAKEKGYATTLYHRKRPMPELTSSNFMQRSFGERVAMNAPIQGTAADIMKLAMIRVSNRLKEEGLQSRLLVQVHDELLIEAPLSEKETIYKVLEEEMTRVADLLVQLEVDVHDGQDWYEAK